MKLSGREAERFCTAPDRRYAALLIYGEDTIEVGRRRELAVSALLGAGREGLARVDAGAARRDAAVISDALRTRGFFEEERVVLIEGGTDGLTASLTTVLDDGADEDAFLIVTAGLLPARSKLRRFFEAEQKTVAAPCYVTALDARDVSDLLVAAKVEASDEAVRDLVDFARGADRGALSDLIARLSLYKLGDATPLSPADVAACAPGTGDAAVDEAVDAIAEGRAGDLGPVLARLQAQGIAATTLAIGAARRFRQLHALASARGGVEAAVGALRPPVFGPRRDALLRQARLWPGARAEGALKMLLELDGDLRGGAEAAGFAYLERAFLRLALAAGRTRG